MTIKDSQVHAYEAPAPKRPWHLMPGRQLRWKCNRHILIGPPSMGGACVQAYAWSPKKP
jgi:hypothetical protein